MHRVIHPSHSRAARAHAARTRAARTHAAGVSRCLRAFSLIVPLGLYACSAPTRPDVRRAIAVEASTPQGEPVHGTRVWADGRELGVTREDGRLRAELSGRAGETVVLTWSCPSGYRALGERRSVVLGTLESVAERATPALALRTGCEPVERQAALVVRARGAHVAGLPIRVRDEVVGQTDEDGVAHVLLRARPGTTLRVALDTGARPELRPASPVETFQIDSQDAVLLFAQDFTRPANKPRARNEIARPAAPAAPYRIH